MKGLVSAPINTLCLGGCSSVALSMNDRKGIWLFPKVGADVISLWLPRLSRERFGD